MEKRSPHCPLKHSPLKLSTKGVSDITGNGLDRSKKDGSERRKIFTISTGLIFLFNLLVLDASAQQKVNEQNYFQLSLEELSQIKVTTGSLISTEKRYSPSSIIVISREMIESSGARDLIEILSIFVPGFQYLRHPALPDRIGMRGMISDLNDKMLFLVNGKIMNSQPLLGIDSEFDLSMLDDIEKIEVVNGPGSATYGSGAINGVVSITTRNADTYKGIDASVRIGAIEEFYNAQVQWGGKFPLGGKLYMYYGLDKYYGAPDTRTPVFFGNSFTVKGTGITVTPDKAVDLPFLNDYAADRDLRHKAFTQYQIGNFSVWARFTEGGTSGLRSGRALLIQQGFTNTPESYNSTYRQYTAVMNYSIMPIIDWKIDAQLAFDKMNASWYLRIPSNYGSNEKKYSGKITVSWNPLENQSAAIGTEFMYGVYNGLLDPGSGATNFSWNTNYFALFAEHSWNFHPKWHSTLTMRLDKRTYTDYAFSPRIALIFEPQKTSTLSLSWSRSNRLGDEYYNEYYRSQGINNDPGVEKVESTEFKYTQLVGSRWLFQILLHYTNQDILAWDHARKTELMQGNVTYYGAEFIVDYRTDKLDVILSQIYNKMLSMGLSSPDIKTLITSAPYGYGNDFHMVPRHMTKFSLNFSAIANLIFNASLQKIWNYEGAKDFARYNNEILKNPAYTLTDPVSNINFDGPTTLNFGALYSVKKHVKINLWAYNALGWFNNDFNKRRYYSCMDAYRDEAPAFTIELKVNF
jgi:iron complex outermembrane receptor protein